MSWHWPHGCGLTIVKHEPKQTFCTVLKYSNHQDMAKWWSIILKSRHINFRLHRLPDSSIPAKFNSAMQCRHSNVHHFTTTGSGILYVQFPARGHRILPLWTVCGPLCPGCPVRSTDSTGQFCHFAPPTGLHLALVHLLFVQWSEFQARELGNSYRPMVEALHVHLFVSFKVEIENIIGDSVDFEASNHDPIGHNLGIAATWLNMAEPNLYPAQEGVQQASIS